MHGLHSSEHSQYLSPCQANNACFKLSGKCFPCQTCRPGFPALLFECRKGWQLPLIAGINLGLMRNCFSQSYQEILAKASAVRCPGKAWGKGHATAKVFRQTLPAPHSAGGAGGRASQDISKRTGRLSPAEAQPVGTCGQDCCTYTLPCHLSEFG